MKINKKFFYKIHTWIGINLSILFFIVCFSGTIATLSIELDWIFNKEIRAKKRNKKIVSKNIILNNLKKLYPLGVITYWKKPNEPYICDIIHIKQNKKRIFVFANPYTGIIQGSAKLTFKRFFRDLHYFLFIPNQIGNFIVLVFGFVLLISLITAFYFYKKWWKKLFFLQTNKGLIIFLRSLHKLIGLWSVPFSILFSITGIWYFIERANIGDIKNKINTKNPKIIFDKKYNNYNFSYNINYDSIVNLSEKSIPNFVSQSISFSNNIIMVRGKSNVPLVRQRANKIYINPITYKVISIQDARKINFIMWLNDIVDPIHFGYFGGLITKIIWFFMGLSISFLILSGIWTTLKRESHSKNKTLTYCKYVNVLVFIIMMYFLNKRLTNTYQINIFFKNIIFFIWFILILIVFYIFKIRISNKKTLFKKK